MLFGALWYFTNKKIDSEVLYHGFVHTICKFVKASQFILFAKLILKHNVCSSIFVEYELRKSNQITFDIEKH